MTEYRIVIKKNRVTPDHIRKYCKDYEVSVEDAQRELEDVSLPQLQYRVYPNPVWRTIETVVEYRK